MSKPKVLQKKQEEVDTFESNFPKIKTTVVMASDGGNKERVREEERPTSHLFHPSSLSADCWVMLSGLPIYAGLEQYCLLFHFAGMGTEIEYAINLLAASPESNTFTVHFMDDWEHLKNIGLKGKCYRTLVDNFEDFMEKKLEKHDVQSIKRTMQMHEDVFKHQVRELHRLYSVQKMLMNELKKEKQKRYWRSTTNSDVKHSHFINTCRPTTPTTYGLNFNLESLRDDPSSRERSGSCSGEAIRMPRGFDLERPAEEDISTGVSAIDEDQAGPSSHMAIRSQKRSINGSDEDSEVELTLSIGSSSSKKTSKSYQPQLGLCESSHKGITEPAASFASFKTDRGDDCSDPSTPMSSSSATFDQERNRPHWLFQGLKLK